MNYQWKILEVFATDEIITGAKYHIIGTENELSVESEGNWFFDCPTAKVPFLDVTEEMIIGWIEADAVKDGENHIQLGIKNQLKALKSYKPVPAPWLPQVFKPEI
jgi:hypothetical protein